VIFLGSRFPPNVLGRSWVHRVAGKSDRFTFLVVGSVSRRGVRGNVVSTGWVPDVAPYLRAADFSLCPVQYGAGTKIKLYEALAAGLPTVAFSESLHGTSFVDGTHLLVAAKSERDVIARLDELAGDPALAERIGAEARGFVVEHHDWSRSASVLDAALRELVGEREHRLTYRAPSRSATKTAASSAQRSSESAAQFRS
jgi:glycosyltransferase involved in cell wall biosynthesis